MDDRNYWYNEFRTTERFLQNCSSDIHHHVKSQVIQLLHSGSKSKLTSKDKNLWDRFIGSNPILQRLIYFTYSPPEALELRQEMVRATDIIRDKAYVYFVLKYPELENTSLLQAFLSKLGEDLSRVLNADCRKRAGVEGSLEELRSGSYRVEKDSNGNLLREVIDQSPFYRVEHDFGENAVHIYILDDDPRSVDPLLESDEHFIQWMQWFEDQTDVQASAYSGEAKFYIHSSSGKLMKLPKAQPNPFPLALEPKYKPLRESIHEKYRFESKAYRRIEKNGFITEEEDRIDRRWDLEQIFRKAIMKWPGRVPPPAYFEKTLRWDLLNLEKSFRQRFIRVPDPEDSGEPQNRKRQCRDKIVLKDDYFHGGSLNASIDQEADSKTERIGLLTEEDSLEPKGPWEPEADLDMKRLMERFDHPVDKIILYDLYEACCRKDKPSSDAELSRLLQRQGINFTPQYIGKRRKKLYNSLP